MTKTGLFFAIASISLSVMNVFSQAPEPSPNTRVIVVGSAPRTSPYATPTPVKLVVTDNLPKPAATPVPRPIPTQTPYIPGNQPIPAPTPLTSSNYYYQAENFKRLPFNQLKNKVAEAKRNMQARPIATAMTDAIVMTDFVRIAFYDWKTKKIDYVVITKAAFLSTKFDTQATSTEGRTMMVKTLRGNGTNTPVVLRDETGQAHLPLIVQYPVVKEGRFIETAYYISTHPGLVTPEIVNIGKLYVRNTIDIARDKLRERGIMIQPKIADMAERLAIIEHVDPPRFRSEPHLNVYNDIFTLYALNEGQTYRYAVSTAGAGGMVQMIPWTYRMIRSRYPQVPLKPDFVEGMRDHVNASKAMLLYMQMTWNEIAANSTVQQALMNGIATPEQIMAVGYNSNPNKIPGYINRGGANWTNLIPRETKLYIQVYASLERAVPMTPRTH